MNLDELMTAFAALPAAAVGQGPAGPSSAAELEEFLTTHSALTRDEGYVEFLRRFGGALIDDQPRALIVDVLGFSDASTSMMDMDGPIVDDDGFVVFAQVIQHVIEDGMLADTREHDFAFDATGRRDPVVYTLYGDRTNPARHGFRPSDPDFLTWLSRVVDARGMLPAPATN
jgi:hypothetical protein